MDRLKEVEMKGTQNVINKLNNKLCSRSKFSAEDIKEIRFCVTSIYQQIKSKDEMTTLEACEMFEFLYAVQIICIKCWTLKQKIFRVLCSKKEQGQNKIRQPEVKLVSELNNLMIKYNFQTLFESLNDNGETIIDIISHALSEINVIPKFVMNRMMGDYLYLVQLSSILVIEPNFIELCGPDAFDVEDCIIEIINAYRIKKRYDISMLDKLIDRIKKKIICQNNSIQAKGMALIINAFMSISDELYRYNNNAENYYALAYVKERLIEVIK